MPDPLPEQETDGKVIYNEGVKWMIFGGCEYTKRRGLINAWPK